MTIARAQYDPAFKSVRASILERDGNHCVKCGSTLALEVHHIEGYKHNEPELLITLCYLCHGVAPMGRVEFDRWMLNGKSGTDDLSEMLMKNGLSLCPESVLIFCRTLDEFGYELRTSQLRKARQRKKATTGRCEGQKPFGTLPGEKSILDVILSRRAGGSTAAEISQYLNNNGFPTRHGARWHPGTLTKILARTGRGARRRTKDSTGQLFASAPLQ